MTTPIISSSASGPRSETPDSRLDMPKVGLGTYRMAGEACSALVASALDAGYRHIDTAEVYRNETEVGDGVRASGVPRAEIFLTTKVWRDGLAAGELERHAEASLGRLGVDYVDLLLIHWPNPDVPLEETLTALARVKRLGMARAIGVSNFTVALLEEAVARSSEPLLVNQVEYHPYLSQRRVREAAQRLGVALTAYSPLAQGRVNDDPVLIEIGAVHGVEPAQVALRWLVQQGVAVIPKTASLDRARANLEQALSLQLSNREMARISALAEPGSRTVNMPFAPEWDPAD